MALKEMLVHSYLLDTDNADARFEFNDLIDEEERISMREYILNSLRIVNSHLRGNIH